MGAHGSKTSSKLWPEKFAKKSFISKNWFYAMNFKILNIVCYALLQVPSSQVCRSSFCEQLTDSTAWGTNLTLADRHHLQYLISATSCYYLHQVLVCGFILQVTWGPLQWVTRRKTIIFLLKAIIFCVKNYNNSSSNRGKMTRSSFPSAKKRRARRLAGRFAVSIFDFRRDENGIKSLVTNSDSLTRLSSWN